MLTSMLRLKDKISRINALCKPRCIYQRLSENSEPQDPPNKVAPETLQDISSKRKAATTISPQPDFNDSAVALSSTQIASNPSPKTTVTYQSFPLPPVRSIGRIGHAQVATPDVTTLPQHFDTSVAPLPSSATPDVARLIDRGVTENQSPVSNDLETLKYHIAAQEEIITQLKTTGGMSRQALKQQIASLTASNQELFALWKSEYDVGVKLLGELQRLKEAFAVVGDFVRAFDIARE